MLAGRFKPSVYRPQPADLYPRHYCLMTPRLSTWSKNSCRETKFETKERESRNPIVAPRYVSRNVSFVSTNISSNEILEQTRCKFSNKLIQFRNSLAKATKYFERENLLKLKIVTTICTI